MYVRCVVRAWLGHAVTGFLQPGESLSGYNETLITAAGYDGAAFWRPSMQHFDLLVDVIFACGCVMQFTLLCVIGDLCAVCCGQSRLSKPDGKAGRVFVPCALPCYFIGLVIG
jgi:hypothetical protein